VFSGKFPGKVSRKEVEKFLKIHHAFSRATVASLKVTELHFYIPPNVTMTHKCQYMFGVLHNLPGTSLQNLSYFR